MEKRVFPELVNVPVIKVAFKNICGDSIEFSYDDNEDNTKIVDDLIKEAQDKKLNGEMIIKGMKIPMGLYCAVFKYHDTRLEYGKTADEHSTNNM